MNLSASLLTLVGLFVYFALAIGGRSWLQWRRTGSTGFRGVSGRPLSAEWIGGALLVLAFVLAPLAPVAAFLDVVDTLGPHAAFVAPGIALFVCGFAGTLAAQLSMGDSWRIGVNANERTELVARGLFRVVRNPIFTSMLVLLASVALLVPNVVSLAAFAAGVIGLEIQVRLVEEPYLLRTHGDAYARYAARVGRFLPLLGRRDAHAAE
jgi:protein-S-isoprenylcysteine O-methyltransferase Ste14